MKVFITYEKDGFGGNQVERVFATEDDAVRAKINDLSYFGLPENELREYALKYIHEFEVVEY